MARIAGRVFLAALAWVLMVGGAPAQDRRQNEPGQFDFYVLALSWSPDYCASDGQDDFQQCSIGKKLGFVLHGLWPQYNQGYPSDCSTEKLPAAVKAHCGRGSPPRRLAAGRKVRV